MDKYNFHIYRAVKRFFEENYSQELTNEEIDKMPRSCVLEYYCESEGISTSYCSDFINILGVNKYD